MDHRTQVGVHCPRCQSQQFLEIQLESPEQLGPVAQAIRSHLEAWMASRCPDHLGPILKYSKN